MVSRYVDKTSYDKVINALRAAPESQSCADIRAALSKLGFEVQDRQKGNHKTYTHAHLAEVAQFYGASFDCGHGKTLKPVYVRNILKVLVKYELELRTFLEGLHD